jgi:isopentenyldiphosphate isomerase
MSTAEEFASLFTIMSHEKFLNMEGLGNEVPFFIHAYDIGKQNEVYENIHLVRRRLSAEAGVETKLIGLYDMVLDIIRETASLEDVFEHEQEVPKTELKETFSTLFNQDEIKASFTSQLKDSDHQITMIYQVGEVFPFLRTHDILNQLQSIITDTPLVVFFPGDYVMSKTVGFHLNLFGRFSGPYYRAFRLDDYFAQGNIHE